MLSAVGGALDIFALIVIFVCIMLGMYRGFAVSILKLAAYFVSWLLSFIFSPLLGSLFATQGNINSLISYTEGLLKLNVTGSGNIITQSYTLVGTLDYASLNDIVDSSDLVNPYNHLVKQNMIQQSFADKGLVNVGEYFNNTVAYATLHIICFLALFIIIRSLLGFLINVYDYKKPFPVLKHYDSAMGGLVGVFRGFLICNVFFAVVPIILTVLSIDALTESVNTSNIASFFLNSNMILSVIRGIF